MNNARGSCGECQYWTGARTAVVDVSNEMGECRRMPPQMAGIIPQQTVRGTVPAGVTFFPSTKGEQWCGEYKTNITLQM